MSAPWWFGSLELRVFGVSFFHDMARRRIPFVSTSAMIEGIVFATIAVDSLRNDGS
jgi:hypothetical protein